MATQKYIDLLKLFPYFKEPCVILTAKRTNSSEFDPEDKYAADAILKCITDIQGGDDKIKIKIFSSIGAIEKDKHNILIGGWTELTNYISYMPSHYEKMPHLDLQFYTDQIMETKKVIRRFDGDPKSKSLRAVWDKRLGREKMFYAKAKPNGWLIKDYLVITTIRLKCLIPSADESLFFTSFVGLYGPGTMAVELFLRDFDKKFKESIFNEKGDNPCFQILCSARKINHSGDFSYAKHIDFVRAYAITDSQEFMPKNDIPATIQLRVSQPIGQAVKEVDEKLELKLDEQRKPCVIINGKNIPIKERFFVDLVYLAACKLKRKNGIVDVRCELLWNERHIKDYPGGLKDILEKGSYSKEIDRKYFIGRHHNKISLGIFKADPKCIIINENVRQFDSEHRNTVKKVIKGISWDLDNKEAEDKEKNFDDPESEASKQLKLDLQKIEKQELIPILRHKFVIENAVKILGWKFQDNTWHKEWKIFLKKCDRIYELAGYDKEYRKTEMHLII